MKLKSTIVCMLSILLIYTAALAQSASDYLILQNIGQYRISQPEKLIPGFQPIGGPRTYDSIGESGIDHFPDHVDKNYVVMYLGGDASASPIVEITSHSGSDSDRWLLHEIDISSRNQFGIPAPTYALRQIDGQTILVNSIGGRKYRWLSGNMNIFIEYHGSLRTLPEPLEVVRAYLTKHPSTLPTMSLTQLRSTEYKTKWIKDEMDRRLWLCDKWFMQLQLKKADEKDVYRESVKSMNIFLDYREKYFGIKAVDEKNLVAGYLNTNNGTAIKAKLTEYKNWWTVNKDKAISL